ncbi:MAG: deoxyribonuclease IV [Nitrospinae bacterium]|nr:deoxyribonuclease IV [Nitrospinota bacterium]MBI3814250.1 deoxyribonuclease IV [Nitrospinota bacterium]
MLLGAHISIEGGVENAPLRGKKTGCQVIQIFTKNNNRWNSASLTDEDVENFKKNVSYAGVIPSASHSAYLINLASPDPIIHKKSLEAFNDEMVRAERLGLPYLIFHPGAHLGKGEDTGLKRIADSINNLLERADNFRLMLLLETTAGQGTNLGYRFEHLSKIIEMVSKKEKIGICLDTCHVFAAGYDISNEKGYKKTFEDFDRIIGIDRLKVFHINDSKKELGSRGDRHEHIGKGSLGLTAFKLLLNDSRFENIPMILETPKGKTMREDKRNLSLLRGLIRTA